MTQVLMIQILIYFSPGVLLWIWEALLPERQIKYLCEIKQSMKFAGISFIFVLFFLFSFTYLSQISIFALFKGAILASGIQSIPVWLRLVLAYFLTDFSFYFLHRAMHNNAVLWRTHKFHHSAERMWWLSGIRGSFIHILLNQFTYLWFAILALPPEVMFLVALHLSLHNCWQHLNVKSQKWMKFIELIYVTPRYHSIHHISEQQLQNKNLGAYFTYMDRIFGTYVNPDTLNYNQITHGLGEDNSITIRMILGF